MNHVVQSKIPSYWHTSTFRAVLQLTASAMLGNTKLEIILPQLLLVTVLLWKVSWQHLPIYAWIQVRIVQYETYLWTGLSNPIFSKVSSSTSETISRNNCSDKNKFRYMLILMESSQTNKAVDQKMKIKFHLWSSSKFWWHLWTYFLNIFSQINHTKDLSLLIPRVLISR